MGLEDLTTLDATYPKGHIEPVSVLDNYQRETRAKLKAWAAVEHNLTTGQHAVNTVPSFPVQGRMYYDKITSELRYYVNGPPGINFWRSVIQPPFNYVYNPEFILMQSGPNFTPSGWYWSASAGHFIYQDPIIIFPGKNSIRLFTGGGTGNHSILGQNMSLSNVRFLPIDYWRGRTVSFGCYVLSEVPSKSYIDITDGVQYVSSPIQVSGLVTWDWLVCTMTVGAGATDIGIRLIAQPHVAGFHTWFAMPTLVEGAWASRPMPQGHPQRSHILTFNGAQAAVAAMNGTNYYGPCGRSVNAALVQTTIPYRFCVRDLAVTLITPVGTSQTLDFALMYNNSVATPIACQIAGAAFSGADAINSFQGDANGTLSMRCIGSASPNPNSINAQVYLDELPW